jgi:putative cell wall-binding protein
VVESRVGGLDRYATAAQVAQATFPAPNANIILASGLNFPDGLAAAGLAGAANAPVLLTDPNTLPGVTQNAMAAVFGTSANKTVHIVGGESAVSATVAAQVTSLGYTVNRIAGDNRYETAADIAAFQTTLAPVGVTFVAGQSLRTVIVATGENFPDALSGGAPAFKGKHPILLTSANALPAATSAALTSLSAQRVILLGGESAVSAAVASEIAAIGTGIRVDRIAGSNRGETAQLLANVLVATQANGGFDFYLNPSSAACLGTGVTGPNIALIVNGGGFADALAAGPHAGACSAPILIAGSPSTATFLTANTAKVGVVRAIGGTAAVSAADLTAAATAATAGTPTALLTADQGSTVTKVEFGSVITVAGTVRVNNALVGTDPCAVVTGTALPASLVNNTCYLITPAGSTTTTLYQRRTAPLAVGDTVTVSGFKTSATGVTAATATATVPATVAPLSATIGGAIVGSSTATVTFNRPVTLGAAATDVTIVRATAPAAPPTNIGPLSFATAADGQIALKATITIPAPALAAGDIIRVTPAAATGVATGTNLTANVTAVVPPAGAAPSLTAATGVLTQVGGVLNTTGALATNVVVQAKAALPAGAILVEYVNPTVPGPNIATSAVAVLNNVTGVTTVTVTLGTNAASATNATSASVAAAINAGAGSVVSAVSSDPTSPTVLAPAAAQAVGAGTRSLAVTATASKTLAAVVEGNIGYDGNNDGFNDTVLAVTKTFTAPSNTFVLTYNLGVGSTAPVFTPGTSQVRLAPAAMTDITAVNSGAQIFPIAAP